MVRNELTVIIKSVIGERNHRWYIVAAIRPAGTNAKRNTQASVMRNVSYVSFPGTRVLFLDLIKNLISLLLLLKNGIERNRRSKA